MVHAGYDEWNPAVGDAPQRCGFEVFALDRKRDAPAGDDLEVLRADIEKYVMATGRIVGTYGQTIAPLK